ncbi:MAG: hypothetical protein ACRDAX_03920 [Propionibacteriaceae bacterium]
MIKRSLATIMCLLVAACGSTATPIAAENTANQASEQQEKPSPLPTNQGVRSVSLENLTWNDVLRGKDIALRDGKAVDGDYSYALEPNLVWSDANGDGHEDAFARLVRVSGDTTITFGYIWIYNPEQKTASQVKDPVGDWNVCGDSLIEAKPGTPTGFEFNEQIRNIYDHQACGTKPLHSRTRTVVVSQGKLLMSKPYLAYGGICYPTYETGSELTRVSPVRVAPEASAAIATQTKVIHPTLAQYLERTWPEGWIQVSWINNGSETTDEQMSVCGFVWGK